VLSKNSADAFLCCLVKAGSIIIITDMAGTSKAKRRRVIVNADDFGFSPEITEGILRAHRNGLVTSTTLAANMPYAEQAVGRLGEVPELGVGVHLNASQGPVLSRKGLALAQEDGVMRHSAAGLIWACVRRPKLLEAIEAEFDAQIRWVLDHGVRPTHLDTHRHAHAYGPIFVRVVGLARRYHIRFVRRYREVLEGLGWPPAPIKQRWISRALNVFGRLNAREAPDLIVTTGTWGVAHTGMITVEWLRRAACTLPAGITEIMTHPGLAGGTNEVETRLLESREEELKALCDPSVREEFTASRIERTHYGKI